MSSIVFVSGASGGLGQALAAECPYPDAEVVNLSRRAHPDLRSVHMDLADLDSVRAVAGMFGDAVSTFDGERVLFLHNAYYSTAVGYVGEGDAEENLRSVMANIAGSLYLAEAFVRAAIESDHTGSTEFGLVLLSSGAASFPAEGMAAYCAGKAAIEQWVRVVRNERARRGTGPWVLAVRPGLVETPLLERQSSYDKSDYPLVDRVNKWRSDDGSVWRSSDAARAIWREVQAHDGKRDVIDIGSPSDTHLREIPAVLPIPAP